MSTSELEALLKRTRSDLLGFARREIDLQAEVHALRDYLLLLLEQHPISGLPPSQISGALERSIQQHKQALLIQLEDTNPGLAAFLSEL